MKQPINLADKLGAFSEHWSPKIVGSFNGHDLLVVKLKGEFVWHSHPDTDDFFQVLKGRLRMAMSSSDRARSMSCRKASSTGRSPRRRSRRC